MEPVKEIVGNAIPLNRADVDTDQIMPKQFLKRVERTGFGPFLFNDWRYDVTGAPNPEFELNRPKAAGASILLDSGFEWREAGCSMCLGMNPDILQPGERCASTSNRNFEGRQGRGARTHLMSPAMAAAAAIKGHLADVRELQ